jgi:hypothetical protein
MGSAIAEQATGVLEAYLERPRARQETAGALFGAGVHNPLRQVRGQIVSARLLGTAGGTVTRATIHDVRPMDLPDPKGSFSGRPRSVAVDGVTGGGEA